MYVQFDGHVNVTPPELLLDDDEEEEEELGSFGSVQKVLSLLSSQRFLVAQAFDCVQWAVVVGMHEDPLRSQFPHSLQLVETRQSCALTATQLSPPRPHLPSSRQDLLFRQSAAFLALQLEESLAG